MRAHLATVLARDVRTKQAGHGGLSCAPLELGRVGACRLARQAGDAATWRKSIVLLSRNSVSATLSKTGLANHPPLLFELVFDEGRRIATAASIPDISSGDRHRGALHSVGTGSKSIVLLSRNSVSATLLSLIHI